MKREIVQMVLDWFQPKKNTRKNFDEGPLWGLGRSLQVRQMHPVVALPDGIIVDGERRWRAAKLVELLKLDTIIIPEALTETELKLLQAATVFHRADWTAGEKYDFAYEVVQRNPTWQAKEVAEHLHIDQGIISKLLSFSKCIPDIRTDLRDGKLTVDDGYLFSQLPEVDQAELRPLRLTRTIPNREALHAEVKARKTAQKNGVAKPEIGRFKATLSSGIVVSVSGPLKCVSDLEDVGREIARVAKHAREKDGVEDLKAFEGWLKAKSK